MPCFSLLTAVFFKRPTPAHDCIQNQRVLVQQLETTFGPDTGKLQMRVGLHSGPIIAGVVRGEKGRFQIFGVTLNTATLMENSGLPGSIQVSEATANLLIAAGKEKWLRPREDNVSTMGKGGILNKTFWVRVHAESVGGRSNTSATSRSSIHLVKPDELMMDAKHGAAFQALPSDKKRLVLWTVDTLLEILRQIMARRAAGGGASNGKTNVNAMGARGDGTVLDEVQDVLALPQFDAEAFRNQVDPKTIEVPEVVVSQLTNFVSEIAASYNNNAFHCFGKLLMNFDQALDHSEPKVESHGLSVCFFPGIFSQQKNMLDTSPCPSQNYLGKAGCMSNPQFALLCLYPPP